MPVSMLSTSLFSDRKSYSRFNALDTIYTPPRIGGPGMVLMKPSSISHTGTSATLGANGQITFSAMTELNVNGCFTADFDNYSIVIASKQAVSASLIKMRLRSSGVDATGNDYAQQYILAIDTSVTAARSTSQTSMYIAYNGDQLRSGNYVNVYGPALAQPTAARFVQTGDITTTGNAVIYEYASTHSLSTSYDGFTMFPDGPSNITGTVCVYGIAS